MAIDKTIKIPRGNSFILEVPIVERLYTGGKPVDGLVSPDEFSDWSVTVERFDTRERVAYRNFTVSAVTSVRITFDETLTVGYYNVIIGAKRGGGDVSLRMRKCFEIVEWNSLSNFADYVAGSPVLTPAQPLLPQPQNLPLKPGTGKNSLMQSRAKEASGEDSVAFGKNTRATGQSSFAEGSGTESSASESHSEGKLTKATGPYSHAEGQQTIASGSSAHAEGQLCEASGPQTHAEGEICKATGIASHAEGYFSTASGIGSHSEGNGTKAVGDYSHAEGSYTRTLNPAEHAQGQYNVSISKKTIHSVGIGSGENRRKNAEETHTDGRKFIIGIGGYDGTNSTTEDTKSVQDVIGSKIDQSARITWNELKSLRDNSKLVAGGMYRITDYNCILPDTMTEVKSAGHQFDIIVLALSNNELSALAWAAPHEGSTYFSGNDLSKWQLCYDIENDTAKYEWASENGKGVIYRMIDEFDNDAPYDFKNIMTKMYKITSYEYNDILVGKYLRMSNSEWNLKNYPLSKISYDENDYRYAYLFSLFDSESNDFTDLSLGKNAKHNAIGFDLYNDGFKRNKLQNCAFIVFRIGDKYCSISDNKLGATSMYNVLAAIDTTSGWGDNCIYNITGDVSVTANFLVNCEQCSFGSNSKYNLMIQVEMSDFGRYCQKNCILGHAQSVYTKCGDRWTDNMVGAVQFVRFDDYCRNNRFERLVRTTFDSYSTNIRTVNPDSPDTMIGMMDKSKFIHNSYYIDIIVSDNTPIANYEFVALNGSESKPIQIEPVFKKGYVMTVSRRKGTGELRQYNGADLDCRLAEVEEKISQISITEQTE